VGYHESRTFSRDTYPVSYITKYTSVRREDSRGVPALYGAWTDALSLFGDRMDVPCLVRERIKHDSSCTSRALS